MGNGEKVKLGELTPRWFTLGHWASESPFRIGLTFECPHCRSERLGVLFDPPIDPDGIQARAQFAYDPATYGAAVGMHVWKREGDTFDTLTLTPSVDGSQVGHWHGFITNGTIT